MTSLDERVQGVFEEVFDDDKLQLRDDMSSKDVPGWDSLAQVKLIVALEQEFNTKFSTHEMMSMASVGDIKRTIREKT